METIWYATIMDLTHSYMQVMPQEILDRYVFDETRQACLILQATNPVLLAEIISVLNAFEVRKDDLLLPGGQESQLAARLNVGFRNLGWREARVDTDIELQLHVLPWRAAGETDAIVVPTKVSNKGYLVDNFKDRVALDVEWNAKDGNLDRDIGAYRSLYDAGFIDLGVIVTRTHEDLRKLAFEVRTDAGMDEIDAKKMLATSTTTNRSKLKPRLTRGDAGGCPLLAIYICRDTYQNAPNPDNSTIETSSGDLVDEMSPLLFPGESEL